MELQLIYLLLTLSLCLCASIAGNIALFIQLKKAQKAPVPTREAKEMLASLMQGQAIVRITVLDPENLMLRSPRR